MQWLIDIVKELIHGQLGYFDRSDPNAHDFVAVDFTQDGAWHVLDLSGIIPADTQLVLIRLILICPFITRYFFLRKNGNVWAFNVVRGGVQIANHRNSIDVHVTPDADGKIEYRISGGTFTAINFLVAGWWLR